MKNCVTLFLVLVTGVTMWAQGGMITGKVLDAVSNEPLPYATVLIPGTDYGTSTDEQGEFKIANLDPGLYTVEARYVSYQPRQIPEIQVTIARPAAVVIKLDEASQELEEVVVKAGPFERSAESPLSVQTLGIAEIERNPGANRDVSRVVQVLPGVATTVAYRNDLLVRGGGPAENVFYLDGVEIPVINHFATQGSSGGPVGIINANFLKSARLYSSSFPANRGNALSSILELTQKDGRADRIGATFTLGSSDVGLTAEGPIGKKATFIVSARHSYLQWLFQALGLPFLPTYTDAQFKVKYKPSNKHEFTLIGLGAFDQFELNTQANETEYQRYLLANLPITPQYNYTRGLSYKYYRDNSYSTIVLRRTKLHNRSYKYRKNDDSDPNNLIQDYTSVETYNGIRLENTNRWKGFKINVGAEYEYNTYETDNYEKIAVGSQVQEIDFTSNLSFNTFAAFGQVSRSFFKERLSLSLGLRSDFSDYSDEMANPLEQLSPRLSASYNFTENFSFNFNTGIYYQLPPFTVLGYEDGNGELVNRQQGIKYISAKHASAGFAYELPSSTRITIEGFYKHYDDYPFLTRDSISLANLGGDYGAIGNEPAVPASEGRSYGGELFIQQKMYNGFYGLLAYTFVMSEFKDKNGVYVPSSWDSRHILSITGGKKWDNGWQVGARFGLTGGLPYTPYDEATSAIKEVWDVRGRGVPDYERINSERLDPYHYLDVRVDKKWYFKNFTLDLYLDIQNVYASQPDNVPVISVESTDSGQPLTNPNNSNQYQMKYIDGSNATVLPTVGIVLEY